MNKKEEWEAWERNWNNAYRFFHSKGNIKTKGKYKKKWLEEFIKDLRGISK